MKTSLQKIDLDLENCARSLTDAQKTAEELRAELKNAKTDDAQTGALEKQIAKIEKENSENGKYVVKLVKVLQESKPEEICPKYYYYKGVWKIIENTEINVDFLKFTFQETDLKDFLDWEITEMRNKKK